VTLGDLVDARVGIVRSCTRLSKGRTEPVLPVVYQAVLSHFDYRKGSVAERTASGKGATDDAAWTGALVEALERYCAYQQRPDMVVRATAAALDAPAIAPEALVLYSERQYARPDFRYRRPRADEELTWVRGELVGGGGLVYVPAALVYMNFGGPGGRELFTPTTSNGLAGGPDLESATLAGLYEVIERDAFLLTWMHRGPAKHIDLDAVDGPVAAARRHYARHGIELHAFDVTSDVGVPVAMAMTVDRTGGGPAAVVGLGCNVDGRVALERAVMEVGQVRVGAVPRHRREPRLLARYEDVHTLEDHAAFAALPEHLGEFDFLLGATATATPPPAPTGDGPDLEVVRERLEAVGATVAVVDLTQPDVEPFGVRVVRALATGLQPIHFGYGEERLGGPRVREDELNPCPHPIA